MSVNVRNLAEKTLAQSLEGPYAQTIELVTPDGLRVTESLNGGLLRGQVLYDSMREDHETGGIIIVNNPVVTVRRSSLERVPISGEKWLVNIPVSPTEDATRDDYVLDPSRAHEGGASIGFIRLYLRRVEQTP